MIACVFRMTWRGGLCLWMTRPGAAGLPVSLTWRTPLQMRCCRVCWSTRPQRTWTAATQRTASRGATLTYWGFTQHRTRSENPLSLVVYKVYEPFGITWIYLLSHRECGLGWIYDPFIDVNAKKKKKPNQVITCLKNLSGIWFNLYIFIASTKDRE